MSRKRSDNSWLTALRDTRETPARQSFREMARYLGRRAAEDDHETWLQKQRVKKLREQRDTCNE